MHLKCLEVFNFPPEIAVSSPLPQAIMFLYATVLQRVGHEPLYATEYFMSILQ